MQNIAVINGPNINILGIREKNVYGETSWPLIEEKLIELGNELNINLLFYQSNHEGRIVDFIQENLNELDGVIINPAAFTKNGYSILEALNSVKLPFIEIHLSNIFARGGWHKETIFASSSIGHICGFKDEGYILALQALNKYLTNNRGEDFDD